MGLLNLDDPQQTGLLSLGLRLLSTPGNFGEALGKAGLGSIGDMQQAQTMAEQRRIRALQEQQAQMQMEDAKRAREGQAAAQTYATQALAGPDAMLGNMPGPQRPAAGFNLQSALAAGVPINTALQLEQSMRKAEPEAFTLSPGQRRFQGGREVAAVPAEEKPINMNDLMIPDGKGGYMVNQALLDAKRAIARDGAASQSMTFGSPVPVELPGGGIGYVQPSNRGGPVEPMRTPEGTALRKPVDAKDKDLTEAQSKATAFLGQMRSATKSLQAIGADQSALSTQAETALAGGPMNIVVTQKAQRIRQAQEQWAEAFLRFKTGAAATEGEVVRNIRTYFPQIGDKPEQIAQKARERAQAERDMEIAAGRGAGMLSARDAAAPAPAASDAVRKFNPATGKIE